MRRGLPDPVVVGPTVGHQGVECHPWLGVPDAITNPEDAARFLTERWQGQVIDLPHRPVTTIGRFRGMLAFFCALLPTDVVRRVGPLDEQFGWGYCEDDDYCMRLRQAGYRLSLCPGAVVSHPVARTLRHVPDDPNERLARNMDRFEAKWGRRPT